MLNLDWVTLSRESELLGGEAQKYWSQIVWITGVLYVLMNLQSGLHKKITLN